jgi:DNA-binding MarR family transcriptional regulator
LGVVEHGDIPVAHAARDMGLTRQTVQQSADALARDGFIEYVENPHHRRAKLMSITSEGREALDYVQRRQGAWADRIAGKLALEDLRAATKILGQVRDSLEQNMLSEAEI